jgi:hypothetical protein
VIIPSAKILTDPLGLAGYALFLIFGAITLVLKKRLKKHYWLIPTGAVLGALCIIAGLSLAFFRGSRLPPPPVAPVQSMHLDSVEQTVTDGSAVTGVQGSVTIDEKSTASQKAKQKQKGASLK